MLYLLLVTLGVWDRGSGDLTSLHFRFLWVLRMILSVYRLILDYFFSVLGPRPYLGLAYCKGSTLALS